MSRFLALLCLVASAASGQDATGVIVGTVTEAESGDALPAVNVLVVGTTRGASTGVDGAYRIEAVPRGPVTLRFSFIGYEPVQVDAVVSADPLRVDAALVFDDCLEDITLSVAYTPRGVFSDLPTQRHDDGRPLRVDPLSALSDRASRSLALDGGADRLGRWQPALGGLGAPAIYVDGVRALSLDDLPADAVWRGHVHARYVPAAYGASAAGAIDVLTSVPESREVGAGLSGRRPAALLRVGERVPLAVGRCGEAARRLDLLGEGALAVARSVQTVDGRARVEYRGGPNTLAASVDGAVRRRDETEAQATGRVRWGTLDWYEPRFLAASGGVRQGDGQTVTFSTFRAEVQAKSSVEFVAGAEGAAFAYETIDSEAATSSLAGYLQVGVDGDDLRRVWSLRPSIQTGLRVERIGTEGPAGEQGVWTVQPRVLGTIDLSRLSRALDHLYTYGTLAAGAVPDGSGRVVRRAEGGSGVRLSGDAGGLVGYVRRVDGLEAAAVVAGADADASVDIRIAGDLGATAWGRGRLEAGDARFARDRWTLGADWTIYHSYASALRHFTGTYGAHLDVSEGVSEADGRRPRVVRLGASATLGREYRRRVRIGVDAVVRGRDAVPCVDPFGGPEAADTACPVPDARVLVAVPL